MNLKPLVLLLLLISASLLAHSTDRGISTLSSSTITEPVGEVFTQSVKTPAGLTRLTLYRPSKQPGTGAASLELNDHYSLRYGQHCVGKLDQLEHGRRI
jgi:hypothetical protein